MLNDKAHCRPGGSELAMAIIACRVLEAEIAALTSDATHIVRREFLEVGLHDQPTGLRTRLAAAIGRAEDDPSVRQIVLVYGLCGLALAGLGPRRCPLVVARAHDCVTFFLGSKERYAVCMRDQPGTYWYSPGWNREKRVPGPDREEKLRAEYTERFGPDEAKALLEMDSASLALHTSVGYTDLGMPSDDEQLRYAERCAKSLGWSFRNHQGDATLLRDLLRGPWDDERFLIVQSGQRITHCVDSRIIQAVPDQAHAAPGKL